MTGGAALHNRQPIAAKRSSDRAVALGSGVRRAEAAAREAQAGPRPRTGRATSGAASPIGQRGTSQAFRAQWWSGGGNGEAKANYGARSHVGGWCSGEVRTCGACPSGWRGLVLHSGG
ncbi:MAG: hypothetical protein GY934_18145 [Gammaproteobacteria bacterium]|nr:hypothetical protein [Gammaproteobacteria bacterium]